MTRVPGVGKVGAKIMLVGEAWGENEEKSQTPFCGMAGKVLDGVLEEAGITREDCYITNVVQKRPAGNNFKIYYEKGKPTPELLEAYQGLYEEIARVRPNVIVALGGEALKALTGKGGIEDWRGSVLMTPYGKVIPTIHPAAVSRHWSYRPAVVVDMGKVKRESEFPEVKEHNRVLVTVKDFEVLMRTLKAIRETADRVAFDIEVESEQITAIGISWKLDWAISIPFWFGASGSLWTTEEEGKIWQEVRGILEDERIGKIAHNAAYDIEYLKYTLGIEVKGLVLDTMLGFHVLYPELPKNLAFLVSIYTDHPFYKYMIKSESMDEYFRYNATDACLTFEVAGCVERELEETGLRTFYAAQVHALIDPLLLMQDKGVKFDSEKRNKVKREYEREIDALKKRLVGEVGHELNTASHPQMVKWLYEELKLSKIYKRRDNGTKTLSADEEALEELYQKTKNPALKTILEIREREKILSTYLGVKLDRDGRIRCSYMVTGTETGRLSSRASSRGTGTNLQNVPPGIVRSLFVADDGKVFINADLSQAEARVVAYLSYDRGFIRVFEAGGDIHRKNAANIFNKKEEEVSDQERQMAKRVVHASNYGMGPRTFAKTAGISEGEAKRLLNQYFATYPGIKNWQMRVQDTLRRTRCLTTPLGRKRVFFNQWGDSLLKEGLAYLPQSTVADVVNQGLICLYKKAFEGLDILLQVHDSILIQVPEGKVKEGAELLIKCLTVPIEIEGRVLTIPVDIKVGKNWEELKKWIPDV